MTIHSIFDNEGRRIAEYDEASGTLIREYVWNGWDPIAVIEGGQVYFVRVDHIGRPVFATNSSGTQVWSASYLPFGGVHTVTGSLPANRFPGQWFQAESGLHQNWMRDYDPTTGRYIQADPLGLMDGASVYGYVKQNPGRWIDPRGEQCRTVGRDRFGTPIIECDSGRYCPPGQDCNWRNPTENVHPESEYAVCKTACENTLDIENWKHGPNLACMAIGNALDLMTRGRSFVSIPTNSLCIDAICTSKCATQCGIY